MLGSFRELKLATLILGLQFLFMQQLSSIVSAKVSNAKISKSTAEFGTPNELSFRHQNKNMTRHHY